MNKTKITVVSLIVVILGIVSILYLVKRLNLSNEGVNIYALDEVHNDANNTNKQLRQGFTQVSKENGEEFEFEYDYNLEDYKNYGFKYTDFNAQLSSQPDYSNTITKEEANKDIEAMFYLLKNTYAAYGYFGGDEKFNQTKSDILEDVDNYNSNYNGNEENVIKVEELKTIINENLYFIEDCHFTIGLSTPYQYKKNEYVKILFSNDELLFNKDEIGYYTTTAFGKKYLKSVDGDNNLANYIYPTISESGEIKYIVAKSESIYAENVFANLEIERANGKLEQKNVELFIYEPIGKSKVDEVVGTKEYGNTIVIDVPSLINGNDYLFYKTAAQANDYENVVIDLRGNVGGFDSAVAQWISTFAGGANVLQYKNYEILNMNIFNGGNTRPWSYEYKVSEKEDLIPNDKKVYIIVEKGVMSSGESLIMYFRNMENVVLVGTNSKGGVLVGNNRGYTLPNSDIYCYWGETLYLGYSHYIKEGVGTIPDILVPNTKDTLDLTLKMIEYYN